MNVFLATFGIFVLVIFGMSLGYIIKKKSIKGSCGGLSSLGIAKACDCDAPCDTLQAKLDAGDARAQAEYEQKFARKPQSQFYEVN